MAIRVVHGDCLDVLPTLAAASFDAVVTDPPYSAAGGNTNGRSSGADKQYWRFWFSNVWAEIARVATPDAFALVFCDWRMVGTVADCIRGGIDRQTSKGWEVTQALVWDREHIGLGSPYRNSYEMIAFARGPEWRREVFPRDVPTVVRHRWTYGTHEFHGAEKPVDLIRGLLLPHAPSRVLDPFCGSGSTGVACRDLGIGFLGIESDDRYCAIANRRVCDPDNLYAPAPARADAGDWSTHAPRPKA